MSFSGSGWGERYDNSRGPPPRGQETTSFNGGGGSGRGGGDNSRGSWQHHGGYQRGSSRYGPSTTSSSTSNHYSSGHGGRHGSGQRQRQQQRQQQQQPRGEEPSCRYDELMELAKGKTTAERRELFSSLDWEDKLVVQGFPPAYMRWANPLPEELPHEALVEELPLVMEKKQAAARRAIEKVSEKAAVADDDYDEYDDDESMSSEESCKAPYDCKCPDCRSRKRQKNVSQCEPFLLALPYCLLFDTSFRVRWPRKSETERCWCPCGAYMKPWQDFFALTNAEDVKDAAKICGNEGKKKKAPDALIAHLRKQGDRCDLHYGVSVYVEELYKDWNGSVGHKALYKNVNHAKYQQALSIENKQNRRLFDDMQAALQASMERERLMREENEEFKKRMESLNQVNPDLKVKVEENHNLLEELGLERESKEPELSERDFASYRLIWETFLDDLKAKNERHKNKQPIKFAVSNNFRLQDLFDDLDDCDKDNSFLMRDLSVKGRSGERHKHAPKLIFDWEILFGEAVDEGGPTKHFFDQVWQQLQALQVKAFGVEVDLFDESPIGVTPNSNEKLTCAGKKDICSDVVETLVEKAKRYYRAVGRIMFHSLVRREVISFTAMPAFYRNVVFRECDIQDGRYKHSKIVMDLHATGAEISKHWKDMRGHPISLFGTETDNPDEVITKENFFTKIIPHNFISERSIALDALREGLTLDGYADVPGILRTMPEKAISTLLFAPARIEANDVIGALEPQYSAYADSVLDTQKHFFENVVKGVIRERSEDDKTFLPNFLSFVTGLTFMPHKLARPDYKIYIEFDESTRAEKARPQSKTCVNALILPCHAYNGDKELFETLLKECLLEMKENNFSDE